MTKSRKMPPKEVKNEANTSRDFKIPEDEEMGRGKAPQGPGGGRGPRGPIGIPEKADDFKGTMKRMISYLGGYRWSLVLVILLSVFSTAFSIIGPKILSLATTTLFNGLVNKVAGTGTIDFERIATILLILVAVYLFSALFSFIQHWSLSTISQKLAFKMRKQISEKMMRMPMSYFESRTVGDVLSRLTNDVDTFSMSLNQSISQLITSGITIIGVLVMMLIISPLMTLIALVILPISAGLVKLIVSRSQKHFKNRQKYLGSLNGRIEETYSGHSVVRAYNQEDKVFDDYSSINDRLWEASWKSEFLSGLMHPIMNFVGNLGYVGVAISGSLLAVRRVITVGDIQAFIQYVRSFTQPISQMAQVSNMIQSMTAAAERVFVFLDEEEEDQNTEGYAGKENTKGKVEFEHVAFGYNPNEPVINDFNCTVEPGEMVAIVGPTGSGKTTMVKLLMRFYDVQKGRITVDGKDIKEYNRPGLREQFGMVLQDTWLFKGSIMENIRYGRLEATDEEVISAAKAAHAHSFIMTLPGGYDMQLNEEASNVSQGQKQLLTIARAILADNPILILDEATSSVDTRTEMNIQNAMANLMKGRTSFVIAHRLSTIKDADMILVMDKGNIVEKGTHEELLEKGGFYAKLYNSQFERS